MVFQRVLVRLQLQTYRSALVSAFFKGTSMADSVTFYKISARLRLQFPQRGSYFLCFILIFHMKGGKLKAPHKLQFNITLTGKTIGIDGFL